MSLVDLASKIYTVKSRKNLSASSAFTSLIREDLAMRFSVFNITKALTGSEFIATILQSKYGKLTPIQREEAAAEKKQLLKEKRFKQFTVNSIVNLNNKITTLTALTEKNTALILNLYNDLGSFRNIRRDEINKISSLSAVRTKIRSRTVKYQIDQIRDQINLLQEVTVGRKIPRTRRARRNTQETPGGVLGGITIRKDGRIISTATKDINFTGRHVQKAEKTGINSVAVVIEPSLVEDILNMAQTGGRRGPGGRSGTASKILTKIKDLFTLKRVGVGAAGTGAAYIGYETLNTVAGKMQQGAAEITAAQDEAALKYGLKIKRGRSGAAAGFEIDGKQYEKFEDLPLEYQNIVNAYIVPIRSGGRPPDTRSGSARSALKTIEENRSTYKLLETAEGRSQVLGLPPPASDNQVPVAAVAAAAAGSGGSGGSTRGGRRGRRNTTPTDYDTSTPNVIDTVSPNNQKWLTRENELRTRLTDMVRNKKTLTREQANRILDYYDSIRNTSGSIPSVDQIIQNSGVLSRLGTTLSATSAQSAATNGQTNANPPPISSGTVGSGEDIVKIAATGVGLSEQDAARVREFLAQGGISVTDPATEAWCASYVNSILSRAGYKGKTKVANSFQAWGAPVSAFSQVKAGDVVLQTRGLPASSPGGHVGIATGRYVNGRIEMIAGNTGRAGAGVVKQYFVPTTDVVVRRATDREKLLNLAGNTSQQSRVAALTQSVTTSTTVASTNETATGAAAIASLATSSVAPPPQQMAAYTASNQQQSSMGEVVGSAALIQGETLQNSVVSLNNRISSLEEIIRMDREDKSFPIVRNQAELQTGYA